MMDYQNSKILCNNCKTNQTPLWRRGTDGSYLCNACGLYFKVHNTNRPLSLKTETFKHRHRVKLPSSPSLDSVLKFLIQIKPLCQKRPFDYLNGNREFPRTSSLPDVSSSLARIGDIVAVQIAPSKIRHAILLNWTLRQNIWCACIAWIKQVPDLQKEKEYAIVPASSIMQDKNYQTAETRTSNSSLEFLSFLPKIKMLKQAPAEDTIVAASALFEFSKSFR